MSLPQPPRRAFTGLRFELLDSLVKHGCYHHLPYERTCICGAPAIDNIAHILFECELYSVVRHNHLSAILEKTAHWNVNYRLSYFLQSPKIQVVKIYI